MKKFAKIKATLLIVVLILLGCMGFNAMGGPTIYSEYISRAQNDDLDFSFGFCGDSTLSGKSVNSSKWINENTLLIKGTATPNCSTSWMFGDYQITEDSLTLTYTPIIPSLSLCVCSYEVEYEISNLEKRDYSIELIEGKAIYKEPEPFYKLFGL